MNAFKAHSVVQHAMRGVHREEFLPLEQRARATDDAALPIGFSQTISQPTLVAEMTTALRIDGDSRVLEIGTGSGFQTAILAEIASDVFTIERIPELAESAHVRLSSLGYKNIHFRVGNGALGWPEEGPFDAIIVTAAPRMIPPALVQQLSCPGRMVVPVGSDADSQVLLLVTKDGNGRVAESELFGVRFVPFIGEEPG